MDGRIGARVPSEHLKAYEPLCEKWVSLEPATPLGLDQLRFPASVQDFRKLKVWQKSHRLVIDLELAIRSGPRWNFPGLRRQTLRAAGSIPDTLAEGCGKESPRELARYADMASGSASELIGQLLRARDLGLFSQQLYRHFERRIEEIRRMLWSLAVAIRRKYPE